MLISRGCKEKSTSKKVKQIFPKSGVLREHTFLNGLTKHNSHQLIQRKPKKTRLKSDCSHFDCEIGLQLYTEKSSIELKKSVRLTLSEPSWRKYARVNLTGAEGRKWK